jgi:hypothetical protein
MLIASAAAIAVAAAAATCEVNSPPHTVALVELYTSQGCSSCPPADRWLSQLPSQFGRDRAVPLALHVGYWDYIGWKDPFAQRAFNERQRLLARRAGSTTVYTPEVFVGGAELATWSRTGVAARSVAAINARTASARIRLKAQPQSSSVKVEAAVEGVDAARGPVDLFLALKQHGHATRVSAGENRGETLRNDHVVRYWSGALAAAAVQTIALPPDGPREFELVAFAQDARGEILQTVALPLGQCGKD